jgi:hypothetical protein
MALECTILSFVEEVPIKYLYTEIFETSQSLFFIFHARGVSHKKTSTRMKFGEQISGLSNLFLDLFDVLSGKHFLQ